jgi:hypothetical protein
LCHSLQYTSPLQPLHGAQQWLKTSTSSQAAWQKPIFFTQHLCEQQSLPQQLPQPQAGSQQLLQHGSQQLLQPQAGSQHPPPQSRHGHHGTRVSQQQSYVWPAY